MTPRTLMLAVLATHMGVSVGHASEFELRPALPSSVTAEPAPESQSQQSFDEEEKDPNQKETKKERKLRWKDSRTPVISGYIQAYYKHRIDAGDIGSSTENGFFRLGRVRLRVKGHVHSNVSYEVEIDPRTPAIGGLLRDAYVDFHVLPRHRLRIGQKKPPFGYENRQPSSRMYTVTRSEIAEGIARGVTGRDIGIGVIGRWPIGTHLSLEDEVMVVNGAGMNVQADDTRRKNVWGRGGLRYHGKDRAIDARFGISGATGDQREPDDPDTPENDEFTFSFKRVGFDISIENSWALLASEFATSKEDSAFPDAVAERSGLSVLLVGKTRWDVGPVIRYEPPDSEDFTRWTLGAYWGGPSQPLRIMANFEIWEDADSQHDHRLHLWSQVQF